MISPLSDRDGKPVDWWFIYKLPEDVGPKKDTTGFEYLYCDSASAGGPEMSELTIDHDQAATALTLKQIFSDSPDVGYVLWNDEIPPTKEVPKPKDKGGKGHSKGVLAFDRKSDSGFYLLHSTPRFPAVSTIDLPDDERKYGQTYLCISLKNYQTANAIAEVLRLQNEAQVYASVLPSVEATESLSRLASGDNQPIPDSPADIPIETKAGAEFRFMAKNKRWSEPETKGEEGKDFWKDLVGPALDCDLDVETWRRGTVFDDIDTGGKDTTQDMLDIDLGPIGYADYRWAFTKDHAKWGISTEQPPGYVIVADINRQESQDKRGGGGLIFQPDEIWRSLQAAQVVETTVEDQPHTDHA